MPEIIATCHINPRAETIMPHMYDTLSISALRSAATKLGYTGESPKTLSTDELSPPAVQSIVNTSNPKIKEKVLNDLKEAAEGLIADHAPPEAQAALRKFIADDKYRQLIWPSLTRYMQIFAAGVQFTHEATGKNPGYGPTSIAVVAGTGHGAPFYHAYDGSVLSNRAIIPSTHLIMNAAANDPLFAPLRGLVQDATFDPTQFTPEVIFNTGIEEAFHAYQMNCPAEKGRLNREMAARYGTTDPWAESYRVSARVMQDCRDNPPGTPGHNEAERRRQEFYATDPFESQARQFQIDNRAAMDARLGKVKAAMGVVAR